MQISKYFASLGFEVDKKSLKEVDRVLDVVEKKLRRFGTFGKSLSFNISNFSVNQKALNRVLGNALDVASSQVKFEVSQFAVNDRNLQAAKIRAGRRAAGRLAGPANPVGDRQDFRSSVSRAREVAEIRRATRASSRGSTGLGFSGFYGPALALGAGGYGLSSLNQRNQQVVSAQLQSQAVVQQAGGTAGEGSDSFQYLRSEGNRIGFNFLEASGDYNKLISGLTGSGVSLNESQKVFSGFAELARVNKLDKTTQNRLFRALSQVAGKGKLQAEELTGQIAESLPGGTALFAQAYQAQLAARGQGGGLVGQAAISQLQADMKKGKVTSDILTYAGQTASQRANAGGGLRSASLASQAEQARYQNSVSDLAVLASNNGVEEGFARIFRTLSTGLNESSNLVKGLAESFNQATIDASKLLLFPQSFVRALEGRDSLVADWLGADRTKQLIDDYSQIKAMFDDISKSIGSTEWSPTLKATAEEIAGIMRGIANLGIWKQRTSDTAQQIISDEYYAGGGGTLGKIKGIAKANWFTFKNTVMPWNADENTAEYMTQNMANNGQSIDPVMGPNGLDTQAFFAYQREQAKAEAVRQFGINGYGASPAAASSQASSADTYKQGSTQNSVRNENKFDINVALQTNSVSEFESYFSNKFQTTLEAAGLQFNEKD